MCTVLCWVSYFKKVLNCFINVVFKILFFLKAFLKHLSLIKTYIHTHISCFFVYFSSGYEGSVRKNDVDIEDLKNEVYYSIEVARYSKLGFTGVRTNPETSKF